MKILEYFKEIERKVKLDYEFAKEVRKKGIDPSNDVEIPLANSLAERVVGLVSVLYPQVLGTKIVSRILELEKQFGSLDPAIALTIAEEVAKEKFCKFANHIEAMEAGTRIAIGYMTLGYVSSPIEGFIQLKVKKTRNGEDYLAPYFSGPIRSAGGTEEAYSLIIVDHLREIFGYAEYDPTEDEIKRGIHECYEYHERITNLQYLPSEQEIEFLMKNIPVQLTGDPSEEREVYNYKDLPRVETNFLRSGFCLVMGEGIAQKAPKILGRINKLKQKGFKLSGWEWMDDFVKLQKKIKEGKAAGGSRGGATYIQDLVAGRPVFAHPSRSGAFRLRYGRSRNTGYSTLALHPATMAITDGFIAVGTQLKTEKPTKGCTVAACDSVDGPIVRLVDGSVKKLKKFEDAVSLYSNVAEIIYLGDLLVPFGDFANRNHSLEKQGYIEQYWLEELLSKGGKSDLHPSFANAKEISKEFSVSLHPDFIYYWNQIEYKELLSLLDWMAHGKISDNHLLLPYSRTDKERFQKGKKALEVIGCEHLVSIEHVILNEHDTEALLFNLGIEIPIGAKEKIDEQIDKISVKLSEKPVLEVVNELCGIEIRDKAGTFIGARMGRPEKAKLRKLIGSPHVIFPIGEEGGRLRSFQAAIEAGAVNADFPIYYCESCKSETIYPLCEVCSNTCFKRYYCSDCDSLKNEKCEEHNKGQEYRDKKIDIVRYFEQARKKVGMRNEDINFVVKGVRGTSNKDHSCEHISKGILRAKHNLNVNKDGTIRYDMTEMPITHFKPKEIGTSIGKLIELGYEKDVNGNNLENDNQIIEIFPHDIILPACPTSGDEKADDVFFNVAKFVDDELERIYGMKKFFNMSNNEDLIGVLLGCMAPHTCSTVVGRIIGFSKVQALLASPYIHAAMRRDCFDYGTYIPIKLGDKWKIVKIGEFVEGLNPEKIIDGAGTKEKKVSNSKTIGFGGKLNEVKINNFTKHSSLNFLEIKTLSGRKIKVTENHKFVVDGLKKRASELKIGDKLPIPIRINIKSSNLSKINLAESLKDENIMVRGIKNILAQLSKNELSHNLSLLGITKKQFDNFNRRDSYPVKFVLSLNEIIKKKIYSSGKIATKRDSVETPIIINLDPELLEVIGLYIAEGYSRSISGRKGLNQVYIASNDFKIRKFVEKTIFKHFGLLNSERKIDRVTFSSKVLYLFFNKILNSGSIAKNKRIPSIFLDLPIEMLAALLRGYFEGDGSPEKNRKKVSCDSISEGLLADLEFCLSRFGIFVKRYEYEKEPGQIVKEFYIRKGRKIPKFKITKLIIGSDFVDNYRKIGFLSRRKKDILESYKKIKPYGMKLIKDDDFVYDPIISIEDIGQRESYCLNVNNENHLVLANGIVSAQCDGDEAAVMLLMDLLINFSRKFIPSHRGGTQDAPLVLNVHIAANEVDDMIFDLDVSKKISLEVYQAGERHAMPSEVKMEQIKQRLGSGNEFTNIEYSYETDDINGAPICSSYKTLPTMQEKLDAMMRLCKKIRAVDVSDVSRLVIERHFIRDTRGNLRKFSQQVFRCVSCNEKYRRPPLAGKCTHCGGRLIFTISEGSILKYMQPALDLAKKYKVSAYLLENLELTEMYIQSIFGKEKEKQMKLF